MVDFSQIMFIILSNLQKSFKALTFLQVVIKFYSDSCTLKTEYKFSGYYFEIKSIGDLISKNVARRFY